MTISSSTRKAGPYTGTGTTATYPFAFKVFQASDLLVVRTDMSGVETTLVLNTDYSVSLNADQNSSPGGSITLAGGNLASGLLLTMTSQVPATQATDLTNQGGFYPNVINNALDKLTILVQQALEQLSRSVKTGISSTTTPDQLLTTIITSAANASASASTASTAATNAANSASAASTSASNAATSATNAATSASNASGAATSAIAAAIGVTVQGFDAATAKTNVTQSFTRAQRGSVTALTDGATITPDLSLANNFSVTLAGNRTLANPTNQTAGQHGAIVITQDATGSRTLAYGSNWRFANGAAPTLTTTANAVDVLAYYVESATRITARLITDVR